MMINFVSHIDVLVQDCGIYSALASLLQDCSISIANAMEILQSCTKPSLYVWDCHQQGS